METGPTGGNNNNNDNKPEVVAPSFPSLVEDYDVAPGAELSLTFTPNYDWEVSIPLEKREWFWLKDGSFTKTELKGKASTTPVTIKLGVTENQDFDASYSCDVTMKMNSKTQVIAKYVLPAKERTLVVYNAQVEDGAYVKDAEGNYVYETTEASALSLMWSAEDAAFIMPVKVESNSVWTTSLPSWMSVQEPETITEVVELVFVGSSLQAAEGKVSFKVGTTTLKEFDATVPACGEVNLYTASLDGNGEFQFVDGGGYLYTSDAVSAFTLIWPGSDWRMPVMVDAKCNWTMELPEWLTAQYTDDEPENKAGKQTFTFMGDPTKYPLEDATGNVVFKYQGEKIHEVAVTIPGVKDLFSFGLDMAMTSWEFNAAAEFMTSAGYQDMSASGWIKGTQSAEVVAVEIKDGKKVAENPSWLVIDVQAYVNGSDVLQQRTVTVRPKANDSEERSAYIIFCKSEYNADDYFNADGTLKSEMAQYAVTLMQHGSDIDYITMISSEAEMASAGATFIESTNPRLVTYFGQTDYVYELTYTNIYARDNGYMSIATPYSSVKIYNAARKEQTGSDFWLKFTADDDKKSGVIDMYYDMTPSESKTEGYVVFYDATGNTLAIIHCKFDPAVVVVDLGIEFTEQSAADAKTYGATLERLTEGELYDEYKDGDTPVYHIKYTVENKPLKIKVPETVVKHNVSPYDLRTNIRVNGIVYDEYFGPNDMLSEVVRDSDGAVEISMTMPEGSSEKMMRGNINFTSKSDGIVFILVCTLDLN